MANEKQITGKQRKVMTNQVLRSTLRLLVLLRETLVVQGVPADNALHKSVFMHANLVGALLPNDELIGPEELASIRAAVGSVPTVTDAESGVVEPAKVGIASKLLRHVLGGRSDVIVLNPDLSRSEDAGHPEGK